MILMRFIELIESPCMDGLWTRSNMVAVRYFICKPLCSVTPSIRVLLVKYSSCFGYSDYTIFLDLDY